MANWATTSYRIEGGKSDLERVYGVIDGFMREKQKPVSETAAKEWEGNIVKALGATDEQMKNNYLRGFIQDYEMTAAPFTLRRKKRGELRTSAMC